MRSASSASRANALLALEAHPNPSLTYLVSDALRDSENRVRVFAGRVLHKTADMFLERERPTDGAGLEAYETDRAHIVRPAMADFMARRL